MKYGHADFLESLGTENVNMYFLRMRFPLQLSSKIKSNHNKSLMQNLSLRLTHKSVWRLHCSICVLHIWSDQILESFPKWHCVRWTKFVLHIYFYILKSLLRKNCRDTTVILLCNASWAEVGERSDWSIFRYRFDLPIVSDHTIGWCQVPIFVSADCVGSFWVPIL